ncbi:MAG: restriction endonuclease, partial [Roseiflexaceae bacterium]
MAGITIALLAIRWLRQGQRRKARERLLLTEAVSLNPIDFERRVQMLLTDLGWERVEHVGGAGDGGVDLCGRFGGQRYIVQCKRYRGIVSPTHIRDLAGALGHEPAERALLVTTGHVSPQTRAWVVNKPIDIWDAELLAQHIRQAEDVQRTPEQIARSHRATRRFLGILAGV